MSPRITLAVALAALGLWIVLAFVVALDSGAVHLLLATGTVLLVRWWAVTQ